MATEVDYTHHQFNKEGHNFYKINGPLYRTPIMIRNDIRVVGYENKLKIYKDGNVISLQIGNIGINIDTTDIIVDLTIDENNHIYVVGENFAEKEIFLNKYDNNGNELWIWRNKQIQAPRKVLVDTQNNVYVLAHEWNRTNNSHWDLAILKFSPGQFLWKRNIYTTVGTDSYRWEYGTDMIVQGDFLYLTAMVWFGNISASTQLVVNGYNSQMNTTLPTRLQEEGGILCKCTLEAEIVHATPLSFMSGPNTISYYIVPSALTIYNGSIYFAARKADKASIGKIDLNLRTNARYMDFPSLSTDHLIYSIQGYGGNLYCSGYISGAFAQNAYSVRDGDIFIAKLNTELVIDDIFQKASVSYETITSSVIYENNLYTCGFSNGNLFIAEADKTNVFIFRKVLVADVGMQDNATVQNITTSWGAIVNGNEKDSVTITVETANADNGQNLVISINDDTNFINTYNVQDDRVVATIVGLGLQDNTVYTITVSIDDDVQTTSFETKFSVAILSVSTSWGNYLNRESQEFEQTVSVQTNGIPNDAMLYATLNNIVYTAKISQNLATIEIPPVFLRNLYEGVHNIDIRVQDGVGNFGYESVSFVKDTIALITNHLFSWGYYLNKITSQFSQTIKINTEGVQQGECTLSFVTNGQSLSKPIENNEVEFTLLPDFIESLGFGENTIDVSVKDIAQNEVLATYPFVYDISADIVNVAFSLINNGSIFAYDENIKVVRNLTSGFMVSVLTNFVEPDNVIYVKIRDDQDNLIVEKNTLIEEDITTIVFDNLETILNEQQLYNVFIETSDNAGNVVSNNDLLFMVDPNAWEFTEMLFSWGPIGTPINAFIDDFTQQITVYTRNVPSQTPVTFVLNGKTYIENVVNNQVVFVLSSLDILDLQAGGNGNPFTLSVTNADGFTRVCNSNSNLPHTNIVYRPSPVLLDINWQDMLMNALDKQNNTLLEITTYNVENDSLVYADLFTEDDTLLRSISKGVVNNKVSIDFSLQTMTTLIDTTLDGTTYKFRIRAVNGSKTLNSVEFIGTFVYDSGAFIDNITYSFNTLTVDDFNTNQTISAFTRGIEDGQTMECIIGNTTLFTILNQRVAVFTLDTRIMTSLSNGEVPVVIRGSDMAGNLAVFETVFSKDTEIPDIESIFTSWENVLKYRGPEVIRLKTTNIGSGTIDYTIHNFDGTVFVTNNRAIIELDFTNETIAPGTIVLSLVLTNEFGSVGNYSYTFDVETATALIPFVLPICAKKCTVAKIKDNETKKEKYSRKSRGHYFKQVQQRNPQNIETVEVTDKDVTHTIRYQSIGDVIEFRLELTSAYGTNIYVTKENQFTFTNLISGTNYKLTISSVYRCGRPYINEYFFSTEPSDQIWKPDFVSYKFPTNRVFGNVLTIPVLLKNNQILNENGTYRMDIVRNGIVDQSFLLIKNTEVELLLNTQYSIVLTSTYKGHDYVFTIPMKTPNEGPNPFELEIGNTFAMVNYNVQFSSAIYSFLLNNQAVPRNNKLSLALNTTYSYAITTQFETGNTYTNTKTFTTLNEVSPHFIEFKEIYGNNDHPDSFYIVIKDNITTTTKYNVYIKGMEQFKYEHVVFTKINDITTITLEKPITGWEVLNNNEPYELKVEAEYTTGNFYSTDPIKSFVFPKSFIQNNNITTKNASASLSFDPPLNATPQTINTILLKNIPQKVNSDPFEEVSYSFSTSPFEVLNLTIGEKFEYSIKTFYTNHSFFFYEISGVFFTLDEGPPLLSIVNLNNSSITLEAETDYSKPLEYRFTLSPESSNNATLTKSISEDVLVVDCTFSDLVMNTRYYPHVTAFYPENVSFVTSLESVLIKNQYVQILEETITGNSFTINILQPDSTQNSTIIIEKLKEDDSTGTEGTSYPADISNVNVSGLEADTRYKILYRENDQTLNYSQTKTKNEFPIDLSYNVDGYGIRFIDSENNNHDKYEIDVSFNNKGDFTRNYRINKDDLNDFYLSFEKNIDYHLGIYAIYDETNNKYPVFFIERAKDEQRVDYGNHNIKNNMIGLVWSVQTEQSPTYTVFVNGEIKVEEYQSTSYDITDLSFGSLYEIDVVSNYNGVMYANPITLQTLYEDNVYDVSFGTYAFNNEVTYALRFESVNTPYIKNHTLKIGTNTFVSELNAFDLSSSFFTMGNQYDATIETTYKSNNKYDRSVSFTYQPIFEVSGLYHYQISNNSLKTTWGGDDIAFEWFNYSVKLEDRVIVDQRNIAKKYVRTLGLELEQTYSTSIANAITAVPFFSKEIKTLEVGSVNEITISETLLDNSGYEYTVHFASSIDPMYYEIIVTSNNEVRIRAVVQPDKTSFDMTPYVLQGSDHEVTVMSIFKQSNESYESKQTIFSATQVFTTKRSFPFVDVFNTYIEITWDILPKEISYEIDLYNKDVKLASEILGSSNTQPYRITNLDENNEYTIVFKRIYIDNNDNDEPVSFSTRQTINMVKGYIIDTAIELNSINLVVLEAVYPYTPVQNILYLKEIGSMKDLSFNYISNYYDLSFVKLGELYRGYFETTFSPANDDEYINDRTTYRTSEFSFIVEGSSDLNELITNGNFDSSSDVLDAIPPIGVNVNAVSQDPNIWRWTGEFAYIVENKQADTENDRSLPFVNDNVKYLTYINQKGYIRQPLERIAYFGEYDVSYFVYATNTSSDDILYKVSLLSKDNKIVESGILQATKGQWVKINFKIFINQTTSGVSFEIRRFDKTSSEFLYFTKISIRRSTETDLEIKRKYLTESLWTYPDKLLTPDTEQTRWNDLGYLEFLENILVPVSIVSTNMTLSFWLYIHDIKIKNSDTFIVLLSVQNKLDIILKPQFLARDDVIIVIKRYTENKNRPFEIVEIKVPRKVVQLISISFLNRRIEVFQDQQSKIVHFTRYTHKEFFSNDEIQINHSPSYLIGKVNIANRFSVLEQISEHFQETKRDYLNFAQSMPLSRKLDFLENAGNTEMFSNTFNNSIRNNYNEDIPMLLLHERDKNTNKVVDNSLDVTNDSSVSFWIFVKEYYKQSTNDFMKITFPKIGENEGIIIVNTIETMSRDYVLQINFDNRNNNQNSIDYNYDTIHLIYDTLYHVNLLINDRTSRLFLNGHLYQQFDNNIQPDLFTNKTSIEVNRIQIPYLYISEPRLITNTNITNELAIAIYHSNTLFELTYDGTTNIYTLIAETTKYTDASYNIHNDIVENGTIGLLDDSKNELSFEIDSNVIRNDFHERRINLDLEIPSFSVLQTIVSGIFPYIRAFFNEDLSHISFEMRNVVALDEYNYTIHANSIDSEPLDGGSGIIKKNEEKLFTNIRDNGGNLYNNFFIKLPALSLTKQLDFVFPILTIVSENTRAVKSGDLFKIGIQKPNRIYYESIDFFTYLIKGVTPEDVNNTSLTGLIDIDEKMVYLSFIVTTEESKTFTFCVNPPYENNCVEIAFNDKSKPQLTANKTVVQEGQSVTITLIETPTDIVGKQYKYKMTGVDPTDFTNVDSDESYFIVGSSRSSITFDVANDRVTDGGKIFRIQLMDFDDVFIDVFIEDTSVSDVFNLEVDKTNVNEGESFDITLTTTVEKGTDVKYEITGVDLFNLVGESSLKGVITTDGFVNKKTIETRSDNFNSGNKQLVFTILADDDTPLSFVNISITDTSKLPKYTLQFDNELLSVRSNVTTFKLLTENVSDGTTIPFRITGEYVKRSLDQDIEVFMNSNNKPLKFINNAFEGMFVVGFPPMTALNNGPFTIKSKTSNNKNTAVLSLPGVYNTEDSKILARCQINYQTTSPKVEIEIGTTIVQQNQRAIFDVISYGYTSNLQYSIIGLESNDVQKIQINDNDLETIEFFGGTLTIDPNGFVQSFQFIITLSDSVSSNSCEIKINKDDKVLAGASFTIIRI